MCETEQDLLFDSEVFAGRERPRSTLQRVHDILTPSLGRKNLRLKKTEFEAPSRITIYELTLLLRCCPLSEVEVPLMKIDLNLFKFDGWINAAWFSTSNASNDASKQNNCVNIRLA